MTESNGISPLKIANESFLISSSIERCPKTMMLRELVMNALESASGAVRGRVRVRGVKIEHARKLTIWNTGRGMTSAELVLATDLSSTLFKKVGLKANFGMGAKVASLASNKLGLRYRSCRLGKVAQVVLGQRNGVYGRVLQGKYGIQVLDVTNIVKQEADYDLAEDWTEVALLGSRPDQDTALSPFDDNPKVGSDWIVRALGQRFVAFPDSVTLTIEGSTGGVAQSVNFETPFQDRFFDRSERIDIDGGVRISYHYRAPESAAPKPPIPNCGMGAIVFDHEVYDMVDGHRWALEAPSYGFSFAARQCAVMVELPRDFAALPEGYRQFLRFKEGDQHKVEFRDFGSVVAENMPAWLRLIIQSMKPESDDYIADIRNNLSNLLQELGVADEQKKAPPRKEGADQKTDKKNPKGPADPSPRKEHRPPPKKKLPTPPEILVIDNEQGIVDKGLAGRAARYYPDSRQLFVNLRYASFLTLETRLRREFDHVADQHVFAEVARRSVEREIIHRLGRSLVFGLAKKRMGWSEEEIHRACSPESLSLVVDDTEALLLSVRARVCAQLGLERFDSGFANLDDPAARAAANVAREAAENEAQLQKSIRAGGPVGPYLIRLAEIEMRRAVPKAAKAWLDRAVTEEPANVQAHVALSRLLLSLNDINGAIEAGDTAIAHAQENRPEPFLLRGEIELIRGNPLRAARGYYERAVDIAPNHYSARLALASELLAEGDLAGAESQIHAAISVGPDNLSAAYLRLMEIGNRRGDPELASKSLADARRSVERVLESDPSNFGYCLTLSNICQLEGDLQAAESVLVPLSDLGGTEAARIYRRRANLAILRGGLSEARELLQKAISANPHDTEARLELSKLLLDTGELDEARAIADEALSLKPLNTSGALLRKATIEERLGNDAEALALRKKAVAEAPQNPSARIDLAQQYVKMGELNEAETVLLDAISSVKRDRAAMYTLLADVKAQQGAAEAAELNIQKANSEDPRYIWAWISKYRLAMKKGDFDSAEETLHAALSFNPSNVTPLFRLLCDLTLIRGQPDKAVRWAEKAVESAPKDRTSILLLSKALIAKGDLDRAHSETRSALEGIRFVRG